MSDNTPEEKNDIEENNKQNDITNTSQVYLSRFKALIVTHPIVSVFTFCIFTIVPVLNFLGLPDNLPDMKEAVTKPFERHDITITPKLSYALQPDQQIILKVKESQAEEKECKVTKKQRGKDINFTISCKGKIGDLIFFKVLATNCPDNSFYNKLGDTSDVEIYCP